MNDYKGYHYKVANLAQKTIPGNESLIVSTTMIDIYALLTLDHEKAFCKKARCKVMHSNV